MKKTILFIAILMAMNISCKKSPDGNACGADSEMVTRDNRPVPDFSKGVLTEEILWYFGRVSAPEVSPDGKTLLYSVKYFDYTKDKGNAELYTIPVTGGEPTQITTTPASEAQAIWRPDGKKIAFLYPADDVMQIFECDLDGSNRTQLTHAESDINGFSYSPDGKHLLYTRNERLDPTIEQRSVASL